MLFRRISKHVKDQNWFAVLIDFVIVVVGVFIGIQVANWNEAQSSKAELRASLERLNKEVTQNVKLIDKVLAHYDGGRADMNLGRDALNACQYSPEAQTALENLMFELVEDVQPNFVTIALDQLAGQGRYQQLLSDPFQEAFGLYAGQLKEEHEQLTSHYENMWAYHVNYHPSVTAYFEGDPGYTGDSNDYENWSFKLDKPFEEVCADATFRNRFINTIGFYTSINNRLARLKVRAESFQTSVANELDRQ